jgi:hypothetical protein
MQEFIYGLAVGKNFVTMIQKSWNNNRKDW